MSYISKPSAHHPALPKNTLGLTRRDYEGTMSTLCAGCHVAFTGFAPSPPVRVESS